MIKAGGKNFKTKSTLENYCKYVLNNADINSVLQGEWTEVISDVLRMHEDFHGKTKGMSFEIGVRKCFINPRNRQFYIIREDGTDTDFSFRKAITSKSKLSYVKETLRALTKEQTDSYKKEHFKVNQDSRGYVICEETGLKLKIKDSHIDHYPKQFDEIVKDWVVSRGLTSEGIELVAPEDNATYWPLKDKELEDDFKNYHKSVATYRIVLNKVNQQRKKAERSKF